MAVCCLTSSIPSTTAFKFPLSSTFNEFLGCPTLQTHQTLRKIGRKTFISTKTSTDLASKFKVRSGFLPVDPWAPSIDSQSIASLLFAASLFPYLGFLYFITKSKTAPKLTLVGFYFLLAFVGATIPAGIYAKVHYGTSLANVDWLHGGAESLLTITNLLVVLGLRGALRKIHDVKKDAPLARSKTKEQSSV